MKRVDCTSKKLKEIGFETIPVESDDYVPPLKDVAYYLREENFDCKVEIDESELYVRTLYGYPMEEIYYYFEYLYIKPKDFEKWQKVARREIEQSRYKINKNLD